MRAREIYVAHARLAGYARTSSQADLVRVLHTWTFCSAYMLRFM